MQPGHELFIFDDDAHVELDGAPGGTLLRLDGPDGEWPARSTLKPMLSALL